LSRYIVLQYKHGQVRHQHSYVLGTFSDLPRAQAAAQFNLDEINEIVDRDSWQVVWSAVKGHPRLSAQPQCLKN
jgi:hypothetical protein